MSPSAGPCDSSMLGVAVAIVGQSQVVLPVAGISSIAYSAPGSPGTGVRWLDRAHWLTALGASTFVHSVQ